MPSPSQPPPPPPPPGRPGPPQKPGGSPGSHGHVGGVPLSPAWSPLPQVAPQAIGVARPPAVAAPAEVAAPVTGSVPFGYVPWLGSSPPLPAAQLSQVSQI